MIKKIIFTLILLGVSLLSIIWQGFQFGSENNYIHLAFLQKFINPSLYPNDPFIETSRYYYSGFWRLLALVGTINSLLVWFFVIHWFNRFAFSCACFLLLKECGVTARIALALGIVSTFLQEFCSYSPIGKSDILPNYLTHTEIAFTMVLFVLLLLLRRRWGRSAARSTRPRQLW